MEDRWCCNINGEAEFFSSRNNAEEFAQTEIDRIEDEEIGYEIGEGEIYICKIVSSVRRVKKIKRPPESEIENEISKDGTFWPEGEEFLFRHKIVVE